jgi:TonB family protein
MSERRVQWWVVGSFAVSMALGLGASNADAQTKPDAGSSEVQKDKDAKLPPGAEILSDTMGVDFTPYLRRVMAYARGNWLLLMPNEVDRPRLRKGIVGVRFTILPDGSIGSMTFDPRSGTASLDKAAWNAIKRQGKFPPLPAEFHGPNLELRFGFFYNLKPDEDPAAVPKKTGGEISAPAPISSDNNAAVVAKQIGNGVSAPVLIHQVEPDWSDVSGRWTSGILVNLWVDEQGMPTHVRVLKGFGDIRDTRTVDAVKQYRFKPAMENGKPVVVELNVEVNVD